MAPFFILDSNLNIICTDDRGEWENFIEGIYPHLSKNWPLEESKDVIIYISFSGFNMYNLFQVIILDSYGNIIDYTTTLDSWDYTLEAFNRAVDIYI